MPFWISIALLSLVQATTVAVVDGSRIPRIGVVRRPSLALLPAASVVLFVVLVDALDLGARALSYLALVAVPLAAAFCLGRLSVGARPRNALLVVPLFALAWVDRDGLSGQGAASLLCALSCVTFGGLLAALTPARWLAAGIVAMAMVDTALVVSDLLRAPNDALNAVHPAAGLPVLQAAGFGSAVIGYGDLFIAGALGGLLALAAPRSTQLTAAWLLAILALAFDLLFFVVDELPATVPAAVALLIALRLRARSPQRVVGERPLAVHGAE